MKTVAIVPMKLNNRRLPQKNTKSFTNGKPLCHYILSTLLTVEGVDAVYVYCSNPDIQEFIPKGVKYLQRSTSLDQDTTKMNEVLHCFANEVPADIYVRYLRLKKEDVLFIGGSDEHGVPILSLIHI